MFDTAIFFDHNACQVETDPPSGSGGHGTGGSGGSGGGIRVASR